MKEIDSQSGGVLVCRFSNRIMPSISRKPGSHPNAVTRRKHLASCSFHGRKLWLFGCFGRFTRHTARQMFPARWARLHSSAPVYALCGLAFRGQIDAIAIHSIPKGPIAGLRVEYRDVQGCLRYQFTTIHVQ